MPRSVRLSVPALGAQLPDYMQAGCLQLSHVRTVDPPVRRRVELPLHIVSPSPGDTLLLTELLQKQTFLNRSEQYVDQLGQLSLASLWGRLIEYQLRLG